MFLICSASRIWNFCLLFWCSNIVVLLVRIFRCCVVGHVFFFKCWAIELVSESCINQFPPNTIKVIREFELTQKKICRHKMSIMFNEICINEEYIFLKQNQLRILQSHFRMPLTLFLPIIFFHKFTSHFFFRLFSAVDTATAGYDTKQSDEEVPVMLEFWGMRSTPSFLSLPGSLWPEVVAPDRLLFMGWIELTAYLC